MIINELREKFEALLTKHGLSIYRSVDGTGFANFTAHFAWLAYQDAHASRDAEVEALRKDAERWRFFCDEMTYTYGDGYNEPKECHAELSWQQGPWIRDGSNGGRGRPDVFPGWDAVVDEAIDKQRLELDDLDDAAMREVE